METQMNEDELNALTEKIIGCAFQVSNTLGSGFLEKVYENALAIELRKIDLDVKQQAPIKVLYDRAVVGEYFADLLVANAVIVELKAVKEISDVFGIASSRNMGNMVFFFGLAAVVIVLDQLAHRAPESNS